ncbi:MAG: flagellar hook-length control protein FliK, partial [Oligoflexia bacterium]|nr:flagellar hook-length control protein FliK [Oligoflexia bacterium]
MGNATAAGPGYGLLDILFGSKPEAGKAEGKEFQPLMEMIKSLNKNEEQSQSVVEGRTNMGTSSGKSALEYGAVGNLGILLADLANISNGAKNNLPQSGEEVVLPALNQSQKMLAIDGKSNASDLSVRESVVQEMLAKKGEAPLSQEELKLLENVNQKFHESITQKQLQAQDQQGSQRNIDDILARVTSAKREDSLQHARHSELVENLNLKDESSPKKLVSTNEFLNLLKASKRDSGDENQMSQDSKVADSKFNQLLADKSSMKNMSLLDKNFSSDSGLSGRGDQKESDISKVFQPKLNDGMPFLMTEKHLANDQLISKDMFLSGLSSREQKTAIVGELSNSIGMRALQGGGEMKIVIHPENLGEVRVKVGTSGKNVEVSIQAQNDEVASLIRSHSTSLESSLKEHNLSLTKLDVSIST